MLILGAGGFAKEIFQVLEEQDDLNVVFFDNVNIDKLLVFDFYQVLKSFEECKEYFETVNNKFILGVGGSKVRESFVNVFTSLGGELTSCISSNAVVGKNIVIGDGATVLSHAIISNSAHIGKGLLMYYNAVITHDCTIGDYVELSPGATILGRVKIGNYCQIGANATILPDIVVGNNVIIGAGAVVTKDIPDNCVVAGMPARIIKQN